MQADAPNMQADVLDIQTDVPIMPAPNHNIRHVDTITFNNQTFQVYINRRYVYFDVLPNDVIPITRYHTRYNDYIFQTGRYYYCPSLRYIFEPVYDGKLYKLLPVDNGDIFYGDTYFTNYCNLCDIHLNYVKVHIDRVGLYNE